MITPDLLKTTSLFASLTQEHLERLAQAAADVVLEADEWLVREGERLNFFVVLEGELQLSKEIMGRNLVLTQFGPGDFFGEVSALFGVPSLSSLRASSRCRVAQFAVQYLQELVQGPTVCGATILKTLKERLAESGKHALELPSARVLVIGSQMETDLPEIRTFLRLNRIQYEWIDREKQPNRIPDCVPSTQGPSVVVDGCRWVSHPITVRKLAEALEICTRPKKDAYDVVIIGGGPAGLAASVYGASEGLSVLLIERHAVGGQAGTSSRIENYIGFSSGISGDDLSERALKQARRFGAEMVLTREVTAVVALANGDYQIQLDGDEHISTKTVVLTTGVEWRFLAAEGVDRLLGKGVFYGSAGAEPSNVFGKDVFIVGGGNSAGQAAVFSANYARSVTLLVRGDNLGESMSQYLVKQIASKTNIFVETSTHILSVSGETRLKLICTVRHGEEPLAREADVLYVMIGAKASTNWLPRELERDEQGFICTGRDVSKLTNWPASRLPFHLETSLAGFFCAGDVRHGSIKRVSSAVGEGSMTISFIHQFLALEGDAELA